MYQTRRSPWPSSRTATPALSCRVISPLARMSPAPRTTVSGDPADPRPLVPGASRTRDEEPSKVKQAVAPGLPVLEVAARVEVVSVGATPSMVHPARTDLVAAVPSEG